MVPTKETFLEDIKSQILTFEYTYAMHNLNGFFFLFSM